MFLSGNNRVSLVGLCVEPKSCSVLCALVPIRNICEKTI